MSTKLPCLHCPHWVESSILGMPWAEREMAAHVRAKHPTRPTLVPVELPPGSVQSDASKLDARGVTIVSWVSSITFIAESPAGLVEKVREWLAEMDAPTQATGKEGAT